MKAPHLPGEAERRVQGLRWEVQRLVDTWIRSIPTNTVAESLSVLWRLQQSLEKLLVTIKTKHQHGLPWRSAGNEGMRPKIHPSYGFLYGDPRVHSLPYLSHRPASPDGWACPFPLTPFPESRLRRRHLIAVRKAVNCDLGPSI